MLILFCEIFLLMVHRPVLLNLLSVLGVNYFSFQALECLVRLASVRRSLFTNDAARSKFLAHLMTGTKVILQTGQGVVGLLLPHLFCIVMTNWKYYLPLLYVKGKMSIVFSFFGFLVIYSLWTTLNKTEHVSILISFCACICHHDNLFCLGLFNLAASSTKQSVISCQCRKWEFVKCSYST